MIDEDGLDLDFQYSATYAIRSVVLSLQIVLSKRFKRSNVDDERGSEVLDYGVVSESAFIKRPLSDRGSALDQQAGPKSRKPPGKLGPWQ